MGLFDLYAEANVGLSFMHLIADRIVTLTPL